MRIGIIGDIHAPFTHPMYMKFCLDIFEKWKVDYAHFVGDIVDGHALGFYEHDPNGLFPRPQNNRGVFVFHLF